MSKKKGSKSSVKNEMKEIIEGNLRSLLVKLDPGTAEKKFKKRIKKAGKILVKGLKSKKVSVVAEAAGVK